MKVILSELNIKKLQRSEFDSGSFSSVYDVGKNKVGKTVVADKETSDFIIEIYNVMKMYPDVFGKINITKSGHIVQDKFNTSAFQKEYDYLNQYVSTILRTIDLDDLINAIIIQTRNYKRLCLNVLKDLQNTAQYDLFLKYLRFAIKLKNIYQKHKFILRGAFPDIHRGNLALDSNGGLKVIDFINPTLDYIKSEYLNTISKIKKKVQQHNSSSSRSH